MRHRLLLGFLLLVFLIASAQTTQWTELRRDDLHFAIDFPGDTLPPEFASRPLVSQFAAVHTWPSATYNEVVRCSVYELEDDATSDAQLLALQRDLTLARGARDEPCVLDSEYDDALSGFPGHVMTYHDAYWQYRSKFYVVRRFDKMYATVVITYNDRPFSSAAQQFEDSLRLTQ